MFCELLYSGCPTGLFRGCFQGSDPVDRRCHLLWPGQAQLPGVSPEVAEGDEAAAPYRIERPVHHLLDAKTRAFGGELADDAGYGLGLAGFGELLQVREVYALPAELYGTRAFPPRRVAFAAPEVYGGGPDPAALRGARLARSERTRTGNRSRTSSARPVASPGS